VARRIASLRACCTLLPLASASSLPHRDGPPPVRRSYTCECGLPRNAVEAAEDESASCTIRILSLRSPVHQAGRAEAWPRLESRGRCARRPWSRDAQLSPSMSRALLRRVLRPSTQLLRFLRRIAPRSDVKRAKRRRKGPNPRPSELLREPLALIRAPRKPHRGLSRLSSMSCSRRLFAVHESKPTYAHRSRSTKLPRL
jgi:hypothetical protein